MTITKKPGSLSSYNDKPLIKKNYIKQLFDINTLDLYCRYVISNNANIRLNGVSLIKSIFDKVNIEKYGNDVERVARIKFINRGLTARLDKHLKDSNIILQYINGGMLSSPEDALVDTSNFKELSDEELAQINEQTAILSRTYFIDDQIDEINRLANELRTSNVINRENITNQIKELVGIMTAEFNKIDAAINTEPEISFQGSDFEQIFRDIYSRETSPSRCLKTGLTGLNRMLDGGFYSGRVYIFFGTAATGKSFLALDLALQIAKYNNEYRTQDPTKRPCIVFLTMENSVQENIARMFNMMTGMSMKDTVSYEEAIDLFNKALHDYTGGNVNIYMEYQPYFSKDTNYLYQLVDKMRANGNEPICIFQDHIKRIRPVEQTRDMRIDLGNIVNEFKAFANSVDIPVITISHLNRDAAKSIGENKNKKDIIRTLGSNNVSDSLLMVDNSDVGIIINKEADSYGNLYMGFMSIRTRTDCKLGLFFQPFKENFSLKLLEDAYEPQPLYKWTLMDKQLSALRNYTGSDYVKKKPIHDDDDVDMFNTDNMNDEDDSNVLLPINENQDKFIVGGKPSEPIYPMPTNNPIVSPVVHISDYLNMDSFSPWEKELQSIMYNPGMKPGVYIMDDDGIVIHNGVVPLVS